MKHPCTTLCKNLVLLAYLIVQLLIGFTVESLGLNLKLHIPLAIAATISYFVVALKDVKCLLLSPGMSPLKSPLQQSKMKRDVQFHKNQRLHLPKEMITWLSLANLGLKTSP
jgi:hypothetical protein